MGVLVTATIRKVGAAILSDDGSRLLVVRKVGHDRFIIPGGRPEGDEAELETLRRELREELRLDIANASALGRYVEPAAFEEAEVDMAVYLVRAVGDPQVDNEIVELAWVGTDYAKAGFRLGSVLSNHVIPQLVASGMMRGRLAD